MREGRNVISNSIARRYSASNRKRWLRWHRTENSRDNRSSMDAMTCCAQLRIGESIFPLPCKARARRYGAISTTSNFRSTTPISSSCRTWLEQKKEIICSKWKSSWMRLSIDSFFCDLIRFTYSRRTWCSVFSPGLNEEENHHQRHRHDESPSFVHARS